MHVKRITKGK